MYLPKLLLLFEQNGTRIFTVVFVQVGVLCIQADYIVIERLGQLVFVSAACCGCPRGVR